MNAWSENVDFLGRVLSRGTKRGHNETQKCTKRAEQKTQTVPTIQNNMGKQLTLIWTKEKNYRKQNKLIRNSAQKEWRNLLRLQTGCKMLNTL